VLLILVAWGTRFEGIRTYKNSGNEYNTVAVAYGDWEPKCHVEVTVVSSVMSLNTVKTIESIISLFMTC